MTACDKPTVEDLGIDPSAQAWRSSAAGDGAGCGAGGAVEVAMVEAAGASWVLLRVSGDASGRVLVYNRHEWECFLDGAKGGEFDDATA